MELVLDKTSRSTEFGNINLGLRHSHRQDGETGLKPYNYGLAYGVDDYFVTIMAYKMSFSGVNTKEVLRFSSPDYECAPSMPCGIPVGEPGEPRKSRC